MGANGRVHTIPRRELCTVRFYMDQRRVEPYEGALAPFDVVIGATNTGKTLALLSQAHQVAARGGTALIITTSDLSILPAVMTEEHPNIVVWRVSEGGAPMRSFLVGEVAREAKAHGATFVGLDDVDALASVWCRYERNVDACRSLADYMATISNVLPMINGRAVSVAGTMRASVSGTMDDHLLAVKARALVVELQEGIEQCIICEGPEDPPCCDCMQSARYLATLGVAVR